jgi:hypothetical protein
MDRQKIKQIIVFDSLGLQICFNYKIKILIKFGFKEKSIFWSV